MYLRIVRAIDFLTAQPEWDGRVVVVRGDSQGGGQALVAGGLDSRVTMVAAGVPAMCDHSGRVVGRAAGWPGLVPVREDGSPDPTVLQVARYFDAVNFCTRARARTIICVGFIDTTCPPSGGYAAYNVLRGPKTMFNMPGTGHQMNDQAYAALDGAITEYLREARERSVASTAPASRAKP